MKSSFALCMRTRRAPRIPTHISPDQGKPCPLAMSTIGRRWRQYSSVATQHVSNTGLDHDPAVLRTRPGTNHRQQQTPPAGTSDQSLMNGRRNNSDRFTLSRTQGQNQRLKRKAHPLAKSDRRVRGRRRVVAEEVNTDAEEMRRQDNGSENIDIPTAEQYPRLPKSLFDIENIVSPVNNLRDGGALQMRVEHKSHPGRKGNQVNVCTVYCELPDGSVREVRAEDYVKKHSVRRAYTELVAVLHRDNLLGQLESPAGISDKHLQAERGAKMDIYNYAARFLCIPVVTVRSLPRFGRRQSAVVEVTMELKEQGLKSIAVGSTLFAADAAASIKLKQEAERYHAKHGDETIVIKDATALNTGNVKSFFKFYRIHNRNTSTEVVTAPADLKVKIGATAFEGKVLINQESVASPVHGFSKVHTEELAQLVAAVALVQKSPALLEEFQQALSASGGNGILTPVRPVDLDLGDEAVFIMQETLSTVRKLGLPDAVEVKEEAVSDAVEPVSFRRRLSEEEINQKNKLLQEKHVAMQANPAMKKILDIREGLPMTQYREQVLKLVEDNTYCIVMGATGSGKTTQVPQILLDDAVARGCGARCDIICTQPRRLAATSVAKRVAEERGESLQDTVGHHVRFDARLARPGGSINYCTTGILLIQLQSRPDEVMDTVSHIIIDEVHERDILNDFLMILLKKTMHARRLAGKSTPKVVLMSATIDEEMFATYFGAKTTSGTLLPCPSISVPGRTFPVKERHLESILAELDENYKFSSRLRPREDVDTIEYLQAEKAFQIAAPSISIDDDQDTEATIDWKREKSLDGFQHANEKENALIPISLIGTTIAHIAGTTDDGAILVFLPGYEEIKAVGTFLRERRPLNIDFSDEARFKLYTLHSSIPANEQMDAFNPVPEGCRKIILSTNIAETSVTIPDVQYVVDTGKLREKQYDQVSRITKLLCTWVSKSNGKQRAGRAGRVRNGNYYALFSKARHESMRNVGLPEMLRSDLQEICLDIKAQAFKTPVRNFLAEAIEPPSPVAVDQSIRNLVALQALTEEERLTPLGRLLAKLPIHPALGKMVLLGVIFRCLDPMIILGAAMNERTPLHSPPDRRAEAQMKHRGFLEGTRSDHVAIINAVRETRSTGHKMGQYAAMRYTDENYVHRGAYKTIISTAEQIEGILVDSGIIPFTPPRDKFEGELGHPMLNKNANNANLLRALIIGGVHPNIAVGKGGNTLRSPAEQNVLIHPSSLNNHRRSNLPPPEKDSLWAFSTMRKSNDGQSMAMRDTTLITPLMTALFGGRLKSEGNRITMDRWLPFFVRNVQYHNGYSLAKTLMEFRKAFDRVLGFAYSSLKLHNRPKHGMEGRGAHEARYLADDQLLEAFSKGLVEVLDHEMKKERVYPESDGVRSVRS